eukprot:11194980-Lingulodinium_polyedra.AAC.1
MLNEWVENPVAQHGDDVSKLPTLGCGAIFAPWKRGASLVIEMQARDGEWLSFMADRLSAQLGDAIKDARA